MLEAGGRSPDPYRAEPRHSRRLSGSLLKTAARIRSGPACQKGIVTTVVFVRPTRNHWSALAYSHAQRAGVCLVPSSRSRTRIENHLPNRGFGF